MNHECDPRYECVHFLTADELIEAIAPVPRLETGTPAPRFVFRGQPDAEQWLTPSAFRRCESTGRTKAVSLLTSFDLGNTADDQVFAEFILLKFFVEACDRAVIELPGDSHEFRRKLLSISGPEAQIQSAFRHPHKWPWPEHLPLLAFAQHHGVPTRLLDWTWNSTVAAYFAAVNFKDGDQTGDLAVWALNVEFLHMFSRIELVAMPGANSLRLGAQQGVFTLVQPDVQRGVAVDFDRISVVDTLNSSNENPSKPRQIWKLTLPKSEALRLLYLCHLNGVDGSSVYRDAAGAATAVIERAAWSRNNPATGVSAATIRPLAGGRRLQSQRSPTH